MWWLPILSTLAAADERWKDQEIDPKVLNDVTAYTIPKKSWRLGLANLDYGLLENVSLGTSPWLFIPGIVNGHAKVTAVQTPKFDASADAGFMALPFGEGLSLRTTRLGWTGSWIPHRRWGVHFGNVWYLASLEGEVGLDQIARAVSDGLETTQGVEIEDQIDLDLLEEQVGGAGDVFARGLVSLNSFRWALDYRINRRDSIVFTSETFLVVQGQVAAGYQAEGGQLAGGGAVFFGPLSLDEQIASINSLSWQWSWEHFHLRLGIPLGTQAAFLLALPKAIEIYWLL